MTSETSQRTPASQPAGEPATGGPFDVATAFDAHAASLLGFAVNALHDRALAEDCVQETFLRAWRARDTYDRQRASERTWLFGIARHVVLDAMRSRGRGPRLADEDEMAELPAHAVDPLERLEITAALALLSPEHRQVLVEVHLRGLTYAEVSAATGVPVGTLRSRAFTALRLLRDHLGPPEATS